MDAADALQIVLDLDRSAMAGEEPEAHAQHAEAIAIVEDIAVNQFGDE